MRYISYFFRDIPGLFVQYFQIITNFLYVCQSISWLTYWLLNYCVLVLTLIPLVLLHFGSLRVSFWDLLSCWLWNSFWLWYLWSTNFRILHQITWGSFATYHTYMMHEFRWQGPLNWHTYQPKLKPNLKPQKPQIPKKFTQSSKSLKLKTNKPWANNLKP